MKLNFSIVDRQPLPKQSYRASGKGGYTEQRIKDWQEAVTWAAKTAMIEAGLFVDSRNLFALTVTFYRRGGWAVDTDNMVKAIRDGCNGIVWRDDEQVIDDHLHKRTVSHWAHRVAGIRVTIETVSEKFTDAQRAAMFKDRLTKEE